METTSIPTKTITNEEEDRGSRAAVAAQLRPNNLGENPVPASATELISPSKTTATDSTNSDGAPTGIQAFHVGEEKDDGGDDDEDEEEEVFVMEVETYVPHRKMNSSKISEIGVGGDDVSKTDTINTTSKAKATTNMNDFKNQLHAIFMVESDSSRSRSKKSMANDKVDTYSIAADTYSIAEEVETVKTAGTKKYLATKSNERTDMVVGGGADLTAPQSTKRISRKEGDAKVAPFHTTDSTAATRRKSNPSEKTRRGFDRLLQLRDLKKLVIIVGGKAFNRHFQKDDVESDDPFDRQAQEKGIKRRPGSTTESVGPHSIADKRGGSGDDTSLIVIPRRRPKKQIQYSEQPAYLDEASGGGNQSDEEASRQRKKSRPRETGTQRKGKLKKGDDDDVDVSSHVDNDKRGDGDGDAASYYSAPDSDGSLPMDCQPRIIKRGQYLRDVLEFSLDPIRHLFICSLCNGFFREPFTVTKQCLHTFCKSCLVLAIASQDNEQQGNYSYKGGYCPQCFDYLGSDWRKHVMPNRSLERLMDKVLFVDMVAGDEDEEEAFYQRRGIKRKPDKPDGSLKDGIITSCENNDEVKRHLAPMCSFSTKKGKSSGETNSGNASESKKVKKNGNTDDPAATGTVVPDTREPPKTEQIRLVPATFGLTASAAAASSPTVLKTNSSKSVTPVVVDQSLSTTPPPPPPPLEYPFLEVPANIRIGVLKKYLSMTIPASSELYGEIYCNGSSLGNEWTIGFIKRTIWMSTDESSVMTLEFL